MLSGSAVAGSPRPVLVTRPAGRGGALVSRLTALGLTAEHHPLTQLVLGTEAGSSTGPGRELTEALTQLSTGGYSHLVLTSRTAVEALVSAAAASTDTGADRTLTVPPTTQVIAVGAGTAEALAEAGLRVHHVAGGSGAALVEEMPTASSLPSSATVLFPASAAASRTVPDGLTAKGYRVHEVTAYHPEVLTPPPGVASALAGGGYGAIVLTSPMIARAAADLGVHPSTAVITIGRPTSAAARAAGLLVAAEAREATDESLARAVLGELDAHPAGHPDAAGP